MPDSATSPFHATELGVSLTVRDVAASLAFYRDLLGFTVAQEYVRDGAVRSVSLRAGDVALLINQDDGARGLDRVKGEGFSMMLTTTQDVDAIARRITDGGGRLDTPPTDMPWGVRAFRLRDPDGYRLAIASPRPRSATG